MADAKWNDKDTNALLADRPTGRQAEPLDERAPDELPEFANEQEAGETIVSELEPDPKWKAAHSTHKNQDIYHPSEAMDGLEGNEKALRAEAEEIASGGSRKLPSERVSGPVFDRR